MKNLLLITLGLLVSLSSCKKTEEEVKPTTTREASFKIGGVEYKDTRPYLSIFDNNGIINNTLFIEASDGSKIDLKFKGTSPTTYTLTSYYDGVYTNANGKKYNPFTGQLVVSSYTTKDFNVMSGTFSFKAKAVSSPYDTIQVTNGIITNASSEL